MRLQTPFGLGMGMGQIGLAQLPNGVTVATSVASGQHGAHEEVQHEEEQRKLSRRPSYRKILNEIAAEPRPGAMKSEMDDEDADSEVLYLK